MSDVKLVAVFAENKPGQLAGIAKVLSEASVNIRWTTVATNDTFGVFKFLVDQSDRAAACLKQKGFTVSQIPVLAIEVEDRPGGLSRLADCLYQNQLNVEDAAGFASAGRGVLMLEVKDAAQVRQALAGQSLRFLTEQELMHI